MIRRTLFAAVGLALLATPALANQCPANMRQIDQAMASAQLSAADKEKVTQLRNEGEELHKAGKHAESMQKLSEAKQILKIQ
ncbi:MAG TPA: hypothetical protein VF342_05910 [Alphaproteobacteria bacterium]